MKKLLSMVLVLVLLAGLAAPRALAADSSLIVGQVRTGYWYSENKVEIRVVLSGAVDLGTADGLDVSIAVIREGAATPAKTVMINVPAGESSSGYQTIDVTGVANGWYRVVATLNGDSAESQRFYMGIMPLEEILEGYLEPIDEETEDYRLWPDVFGDELMPEDEAILYKAEEMYIDLYSEKFVNASNTSIAAYSVDGGGKWKAGAPPDDISKLLNKGLTLWATTQYDATTKKPAKGIAAASDGSAAVPGATVIKFPKIDKRAKMDKTFVNYVVWTGVAMDTSSWAGEWVPVKKKGITKFFYDLTDKEQNEILEYTGSLHIAPAFGNKKTPDKGWNYFGGSVPVRLTAPGDRPSKDTYLLRAAPEFKVSNDGHVTGAKPASKPVKLTASGALPAPKVKPNYKNEMIKPKAGMAVDIGQWTWDGQDIYDDVTGEWLGYEYGPDHNPLRPYKKGDKELKGLSFSDLLSDEEAIGCVWTVATDKKPASMMQVIKFAPRAPLGEADLSPSGGKLKLGKEYEVYDSAKKKYGNMPNVTGNRDIGMGANEGGIRLKATAKAGKDGNYESGTFAASYDAILEIKWGDVDEKKKGIISARIVPKS